MQPEDGIWRDLVNLIQNLEEVNLCFNSLVAEDMMLIAKFPGGWNSRGFKL